MNHVIVIGKAIYPVSGGIERYGHEVAKAYAQKGCKVDLVCGIAETPEFGEYSPSITSHYVSVRSRLMPLKLLLILMTVIVTRYRANSFIHATTWKMAVMPALFGINRLVVSIHGNEFLRTEKVNKLLMRWVFRHAALLSAVSQYTKDMFTHHHGDFISQTPIIVNHNGLTFEVEACRKSNDKLIALSVCRQTYRKNLMIAVKATIEALKHGVNLEYHLVGTGYQHEELREQIQSSGFSDHIFLHEHLSDNQVAEMYQQAHVFVHPQRELLEENDMEGFGIVIVDGMAKGCIPIIGDNGGPRELVESGINGFKVDPHDPSTITHILSKLAASTKLRASLSSNALFSARHYCWVRHVVKIIKNINLPSHSHSRNASQNAN